MYSDIRSKLKKGDYKIGIWGIGYIGYSSMAFLSKNGIHCLGTDLNENRVKMMNEEGKCDIYNMDYWLGFNTKTLVDNKLMQATTDWKELISEDIPVHLVCIPTEKGGKPYSNILMDVIGKITESCIEQKFEQPPIIIIESTLTPSVTDEVVIPFIESKGLKVGKDILLGIAPRRDWFVSADKTLETLPRVVGGTTPETTDIMEQVLGVVCRTILKASDHNHAAIVKSIENAYRHLDIAFANQLSLAYPRLNMVEILKFVGTKWNVETYHPSFGTGGYCIPLAPQYVMDGATNPEHLTLLGMALKTDCGQPARVASSLHKRGLKKIGILGMAYTKDIKVSTLSPAIPIVEQLKNEGLDVKLNDPLFTDEEIQKTVACDTFNFPEDLDQFDAVIVLAGHLQYVSTPHKHILENLSNCKFILDNMGHWKDIDFKGLGIEYHEAGDANWLEPVNEADNAEKLEPKNELSDEANNAEKLEPKNELSDEANNAEKLEPMNE